MYIKEVQENLIKMMNERTEIKVIGSLEIIEKPIPEAEDKGGIDRREKEDFLRFLEFKKLGSEKKDKIKPSISNLRMMFGSSKNFDISTNVLTEEIKINGRDGEIPVKIYKTESDKIRPAFVFIHGGGWFAGSTKVVENACKYLAEKADSIVISVDYRLCPENRFPAGLHDCYDTVLWVYENHSDLKIDKNKIGIGGDSAGGNLATCTTLLDRELGSNIIKFQALLYPTVINGDIEVKDYKFDINMYDYDKDEDIAKQLIMMIKDLPDIGDLYVNDVKELENKLISPLLADDLKNMSDTLIIVAEYDYLTLEAEAYARKLVNDGVNTKLIKYKGISHAIIDKIGRYPQAQDCMDEIAVSFIKAVNK